MFRRRFDDILALFKDLPRAVEARKELEASFQNDSESDTEWEENLLNLNDTEGE